MASLRVSRRKRLTFFIFRYNIPCMFKIPAEAVRNFIKSEFKCKVDSKGEYQINSIYTPDTKFKCYIDPERFVFCDFKGGVAGSCYRLFRDKLGFSSNSEVLRYIMKSYSDGEFLDFDSRKELAPDTGSNVIEEFNLLDKPIYFYQKDKIGVYGKRCLKYLMDRKVPVEYIRKMGYVYNEDSKFTKRIIIPYFEDGRMVYFQARSIDKNSKLRYLNPAGVKRETCIFNYDSLNDDELIICEGVFDAMSIDPNEQTATCMNGADLAGEFLAKLFMKARPKVIIYVPDQDKAGEEHTEKNIRNIFAYADYSPEVLIFRPPDGCKDLNEMLVKTGKNIILRKECEKYSQWRRPLFG